MLDFALCKGCTTQLCAADTARCWTLREHNTDVLQCVPRTLHRATNSDGASFLLQRPESPAAAAAPAAVLHPEGEVWARCDAILHALKRQANAWPFLKPVDPVAAQAPDYYDIITCAPACTLGSPYCRHSWPPQALGACIWYRDYWHRNQCLWTVGPKCVVWVKVHHFGTCLQL